MKSIKAVSIILIPILLLTGITLTIGAANAAVPISTSGSYSVATYTPIETRTADGNTMVLYTATHIRTGDMNGVIDIQGRFMINGQTGKGTGVEKATFTGTVLGSAPGQASVRMNYVLSLTAGTIQGTWEIYDGLEGLKGIHGQGTWGGVLLLAGSYSGEAHFDPQ